MEKKLHFEKRSPEERAKAIQESTPRKEYREGQSPLEYHYEFPGGEKLEASQDEKGLGHIVIKRGNEIIWDADSILPKGFKFVTPTYFKKMPPEQVENIDESLIGNWAAELDRKYIMMGEFKKPQDFLGFLHEIGHARHDTPEGVAEFYKLKDELMNLESSLTPAPEYTSKKTSILKEMTKTGSKIERRAWADTLQMMRQVQNDTKADLRSLFPSFKDCKQYINGCLATYRREYEELSTYFIEPDFYKELQKYFDKWQYEK